MKQEPYAEALSPSGETIRIPGEGLVLWLGHPDHTEKDVTWWFDWRSGEISVKNPDEPAISKMREIAQKLGARVQGDDGEYYDDGGPHHPEQSRPKPQGSWWRILFGR